MTRTQEEVPLARPVLGEGEERAVLDVLRSGQLSLGPRVPAFEEAFAARLGARHASAVASGTAGLRVAAASPASAGGASTLRSSSTTKNGFPPVSRHMASRPAAGMA